MLDLNFIISIIPPKEIKAINLDVFLILQDVEIFLYTDYEFDIEETNQIY